MKSSNAFFKPVVTEKAMQKVENLREYTFLVLPSLTKSQIKKAVEEIFEVKVVSVRTAVSRGKTKRTGKKRKAIKKPDLKKAIVRLAEKEKIELFEVKEGQKPGAQVPRLKRK